MAENKLKYYITADHTGFEKGMKKAKAEAVTTGKAIGVGVAAGAAVGVAGLVALNKVIGDSVALANVQEEAETKLAAVLSATGEAAGYNAKELTAMAGKMQSVTTVGDEVIISGMSVLATFKQVREDGFERATMAALDMSAVMGTDLNSSLVQIGKSLNDPIKGISSLTRVGVTFTDQQKDQIKILQESGDIIGAQSIILKELESEFGGVATALRDTFKGAVTAASNSFGDLQEQIGFTITKNEFFIESAKIAESVFSDWTGELKDNQEAMNGLAKSVGLGIIDAIGGAVEVVGFFHTSWLKLETAVPVVVDAFQFGGNAIFNILRGFLTPLDAIFSGVEKIADYMGKDFINPFDAVQGAIDDLGDMTQAVMEDSFQAVLDTEAAYDVMGNRIDEVRGKMAGLGTEVVDNIDVIQKHGVAAKEAADKHETATAKIGNSWEKSVFTPTLSGYSNFQQASQETRDKIVRDQTVITDDAEKQTDKRKEFQKEFVSISKAATSDIVSAFVSGEDTKVAVAGIASSYLEKYAIDAATKGLEPIFEAIGGQVGAWVGLGTAQTSTEGDNWQTKLATGAGYLTAAGAAIIGAKAVGNSMYAEGGWIGSNKHGGAITGGSGVTDDVFLGFTDGGLTRNWGMGGEFVMNKEATAKYYPYLEAMNNKKFADGGTITDAWGPTEDINNSGFDTFWDSVIASKGDWWGAVAESIGYYTGTGAGMIGGKAVGKNLFASGGVVQDRKFGLGGFFSDILDPGGVFHDQGSTATDMMDVWAGGDPGSNAIIGELLPLVGGSGGTSYIDQLTGLDSTASVDWGQIWAAARDLPIVDDTIKRADKILYPFVRDTLTPGSYPSFGSVEDMLKGAYEGLGSELATWVALAGLDPLGAGIGGALLGSYETGTDYVPQTGPYMLHQGESVNTVQETVDKASNTEERLQMLQSSMSKMVVSLSKMQKIFDYWNGNGMPAVRAIV